VEGSTEGRVISLTGQPELTGRRIVIPGDPSSAAFPIVAAAIVPGSDILVPNVGLNPHRIGLIATLLEMGADIEICDRREVAGEIVGDIRVRHSPLKGVVVAPERAPSMIDEFPILGVAAACAEGETLMQGLGELRVKESDRLAAMATGLAACGVPVVEGKDSLKIAGNGRPPEGGASIKVNLDHRIGMAFLVLGAASRRPIGIDEGAPIATSFPGFVPLMNGLGLAIRPGGG
jgi:3-phosphoshikimate 1-carboxyvinyltransferase